MVQEIWDAAKINEQLAEVSKAIFPPGATFAYIAVDELVEQDVNPQSMPQAMFDQLINNVKEAGILESVPLCVKRSGKIFIISGHHRTRAARAAGVEYIVVIVYDELEESRIYSKQLAHNSINGKSDPQLIKRVWDKIVSVQAKFEAYTDPRIFKDIPKPVKFKPVDIDMAALSKKIVVVFLSSQARDFDAIVDSLSLKDDVDKVYLANLDTYDGFRDALKKTREDLDIVSVPTAMAEMARLALSALEAEQARDVTESG